MTEMDKIKESIEGEQPNLSPKEEQQKTEASHKSPKSLEERPKEENDDSNVVDSKSKISSEQQELKDAADISSFESSSDASSSSDDLHRQSNINHELDNKIKRERALELAKVIKDWHKTDEFKRLGENARKIVEKRFHEQINYGT